MGRTKSRSLKKFFVDLKNYDRNLKFIMSIDGKIVNKLDNFKFSDLKFVKTDNSLHVFFEFEHFGIASESSFVIPLDCTKKKWNTFFNNYAELIFKKGNETIALIFSYKRYWWRGKIWLKKLHKNRCKFYRSQIDKCWDDDVKSKKGQRLYTLLPRYNNVIWTVKCNGRKWYAESQIDKSDFFRHYMDSVVKDAFYSNNHLFIEL